MRTIEANVSGRVVTLSERDILQGGIGEDRVHVLFDDEWADMSVTAYFVGSDTSVAVVVGTDGYATVPWETIAGTGRLRVSFEGKADGLRLTTVAEDSWLHITPCGDTSGGTGAEPTQDLFTQMQASLAAMQAKLDQMQEALDARTGVYLTMGTDSDGDTTPQVVVD